MNKKFDLLVFIGRFQPLHLGHQEVIERAISLSKNVLVLVGGHGKALSPRNPFSYLERALMISKLFPSVIIKPIVDTTYRDSAWLEQVQRIVKEVAIAANNPDGVNLHGTGKIGLIGSGKDHTSYYLQLFPQWDSVPVEHIVPLNATDIRRMLIEKTYERHEMSVVMDYRTTDWLFNTWMGSDSYLDIREQYYDAKKYIWEWGEGPHLCADSLVQVGGNILLVTRADNGKLALPGGHLNKNEKFENASIRELREETKLRVPVPVLQGSLKSRRIFDDPHRSVNGRNITECFHYVLNREKTLPEVRGSDDAKHAAWYQFSDLKEADFHDDHFHIIKYLLNID